VTPTCRPKSRYDHIRFGYSSSPYVAALNRALASTRQLTDVLLYIHIRLHKGHCGICLGRRKNRINRRKHGVSFETASLVFDDPYHLTRQDREVDGEPRWQTIGVVNGIHLLLVAHTVNEYDEEIRIVSARKATRSERSLYAQGKQDY
jgi:uncharacterized protein